MAVINIPVPVGVKHAPVSVDNDSKNSPLSVEAKNAPTSVCSMSKNCHYISGSNKCSGVRRQGGMPMSADIILPVSQNRIVLLCQLAEYCPMIGVQKSIT